MGKKSKVGYEKKDAARKIYVTELSKEEHQERVRASGLLPKDLSKLLQLATAAEQLDHDQKEEIAEKLVSNQKVFQTRSELLQGMKDLENRTPGVISDLKEVESTRHFALFLSSVNFQKYRTKVEIVEPDTTEEKEGEENTKKDVKRKKVERKDWSSWGTASKDLIQSILSPGREPIVEALAARLENDN